jgi:hypothetical protein
MTTQPKHTPTNYQILDTYPADLRNEKPPRREDVTEIQDREAGDLLCYANPAHADMIVTACNAHADLLAALKGILPLAINDGPGGCDGNTKGCQQCAAIMRASAAIAKAGAC